MAKKRKKLQGIQIFKRYLKENGIYAVFFKEVEKSKNSIESRWLDLNYTFNGSLSELFETYDKKPYMIIDKAIDWGNSLNGSVFWKSHFNNFLKYYENYLEKKQM